jgi:hypothetical protein
MAKISATSYPLDELHAAKHLMLSFKKNGSNELLVTYIKNEVLDRLESAGIKDFEKSFDGILLAINKYLEENKVNYTAKEFYE